MLYGLFLLFVALLVMGALALIVQAVCFTPQAPKPPPDPESDEALARCVASALRKGIEVNQGWRDYGGHGLIWAEGVYVYGASYDGHIARPSEVAKAWTVDTDRLEFASEQAFCDWLVARLNEHGPGLPMNTERFRQRLLLAARYGQDDEPLPPGPTLGV